MQHPSVSLADDIGVGTKLRKHERGIRARNSSSPVATQRRLELGLGIRRKGCCDRGEGRAAHGGGHPAGQLLRSPC